MNLKFVTHVSKIIFQKKKIVFNAHPAQKKLFVKVNKNLIHYKK